MRPIVVYGHDRPLTWVKYNRDGDLIFTCAKDHNPQVWFASTGERLGTYRGHTGSVYHLDVDFHSKRLITGAADNSVRLWEVETGKQLFKWEQEVPVRSVQFATGDQIALVVTDCLMRQEGKVKLYKIDNDMSDREKFLEPIHIHTNMHKGKITNARFTSLNDKLLTSGQDGFLRVWDTETGKLLQEEQAHASDLRSFQVNYEHSLLITASGDHSAKLFDLRTLQHLKTYKTDRPVNAACISPTRHHVIVGGGQDAMSVTTTASRVGKFEAHIFHSVFEDHIGSIKGHFGPLNALAFAPDGKGFASGGEDGTCRFHKFDKSYFDLKD